jgi:hypothetical protein
VTIIHIKVNFLNQFQNNHVSSWDKRAVPFKVQDSDFSFFEGKSTESIKLVDCPVVERTPALTEVL